MTLSREGGRWGCFRRIVPNVNYVLGGNSIGFLHTCLRLSNDPPYGIQCVFSVVHLVNVFCDLWVSET